MSRFVTVSIIFTFSKMVFTPTIGWMLAHYLMDKNGNHFISDKRKQLLQQLYSQMSEQLFYF